MREPIARDDQMPAALTDTDLPFAARTLPEQTATTGRPTDLTTKVARKICLALFAGCYREVAARYAGVDPTRLSRWMHTKNEPYATFQAWVAEAENAAEVSAVQAITSKMRDKPELAIAFLERKHPERWAKVVAQPGNVNINLNLAAMLTTIEQRAATYKDPRTPIPGKATVLDALRSDERREPLAIPADVSSTEGDDHAQDQEDDDTHEEPPQ